MFDTLYYIMTFLNLGLLLIAVIFLVREESRSFLPLKLNASPILYASKGRIFILLAANFLILYQLLLKFNEQHLPWRKEEAHFDILFYMLIMIFILMLYLNYRFIRHHLSTYNIKLSPDHIILLKEGTNTIQKWQDITTIELQSNRWYGHLSENHKPKDLNGNNSIKIIFKDNTKFIIHNNLVGFKPFWKICINFAHKNGIIINYKKGKAEPIPMPTWTENPI